MYKNKNFSIILNLHIYKPSFNCIEKCYLQKTASLNHNKKFNKEDKNLRY